MEKVEKISISEARAKLGELVNQVRYRGGGIMLTKNGEDVAAIVPPSILREWERDKKKFMDTLRAIQEAFVAEYGEMTEEEAYEWAEEKRQEVWDERKRSEEQSRIEEAVPTL